MQILTTIQEKLQSLDERKFKLYVAIYFAILFSIAGIIVYRYYSQVSTLKKRIVFINNKRSDLKQLLERYDIVKKQQAEVDALLSKDKDFVIGGYFNTTVTKLGIAQNKTREPETSSEDLDNGYTERKLYASFSNLTMQKLAELLDTIEQSERIYTKEIEIYKPNHSPTINVNVLIATIEPKIETPVLEE